MSLSFDWVLAYANLKTKGKILWYFTKVVLVDKYCYTVSQKRHFGDKRKVLNLGGLYIEEPPWPITALVQTESKTGKQPSKVSFYFFA